MIGKDILYQAIQVANEQHKGQMRKCGKVPYIAHPMQVLGILYEYGVTNHAVLAAGVLHDVVEDCEMSIMDIQNVFGWDVRRLVEALTKPYGDYKDHDDSRVIKMADRLANITSPTPSDWDKERQIKYLLGGVQIGMDGAYDNPVLSAVLINSCNDGLEALNEPRAQV